MVQPTASKHAQTHFNGMIVQVDLDQLGAPLMILSLQ